jgi:translation initiation factor 4A
MVETETETETELEVVKEIHSWDDLQIDPLILRGIYAYGYEKPSPIQRKAIVPILEKRDIIAQAQSGTGKTATFSIGALSRVDLSRQQTQVLILSPTRELTVQTANVLSRIGGMLEGLIIHTIFGGTKFEKEKQGEIPHIICGCPGRVYDMIHRKKINTRSIELVIMDEADEVLSSGFKDQIYNIFTTLNSDAQIALFSATLPNYIHSITEKIMRNPVKIIVKAEQLTLEGIAQYYVAMENDAQKYDTLKDLFSHISVSQCIIYCNSVRRVDDLYHAMTRDGFPVCCIHSSMDKQARDDSFSDFRNGKYRVLISSNVTSRGIDIQQVSVVINFDIPKDVHNYLHRIGRSGRWGRKGVGINFVTRYDQFKMRDIESYYRCQINEMPANLDALHC